MHTLESYCERTIELIDNTYKNEQRVVIAIAGPPGSGKSTLAGAVVNVLNTRSGNSEFAALLPMDGFHLDNAELINRGLLKRKGAPETFDVEGLLNLLARVESENTDIHYPLFDRTNDWVLPDAGLLKKQTLIVVVEGNYLLLESGKWAEATKYFDTTVFLSPLRDTLEKRLVNRWLGYGFSPQEAKEKAYGNDMINADLVLEQSIAANLMLAES